MTVYGMVAVQRDGVLRTPTLCSGVRKEHKHK